MCVSHSGNSWHQDAVLPNLRESGPIRPHHPIEHCGEYFSCSRTTRRSPRRSVFPCWCKPAQASKGSPRIVVICRPVFTVQATFEPAYAFRKACARSPPPGCKPPRSRTTANTRHRVNRRGCTSAPRRPRRTAGPTQAVRQLERSLSAAGDDTGARRSLAAVCQTQQRTPATKPLPGGQRRCRTLTLYGPSSSTVDVDESRTPSRSGFTNDDRFRHDRLGTQGRRRWLHHHAGRVARRLRTLCR